MKDENQQSQPSQRDDRVLGPAQIASPPDCGRDGLAMTGSGPIFVASSNDQEAITRQAPGNEAPCSPPLEKWDRDTGPFEISPPIPPIHYVHTESKTSGVQTLGKADCQTNPSKSPLGKWRLRDPPALFRACFMACPTVGDLVEDLFPPVKSSIIGQTIRSWRGFS